MDYGCCFVNKIYRKSFKVVNKSMSQCLRFQWSAHPNVVFTPSIGHLKSLTCKEIVATFLSSEPVIYVDVKLLLSLQFANYHQSIFTIRILISCFYFLICVHLKIFLSKLKHINVKISIDKNYIIKILWNAYKTLLFN